MLFDKKTMFSDAQAITADAASSEYVDAGPGIKNIGVGAELFLHAQVVEDFNTLTSLKVKVQQDDNSSFNSPPTWWKPARCCLPIWWPAMCSTYPCPRRSPNAICACTTT